MSSGEKPDQIVTGMQNSSSAIARGQVVIQNSVTDDQLVVISTANAAKPRGVAMEDSPGQTATGAPKTFAICASGVIKGKAGGTITQGQNLESDASGNLVSASAPTTGQTRYIIGRALESAVSGDLFMMQVEIQVITYP